MRWKGLLFFALILSILATPIDQNEDTAAAASAAVQVELEDANEGKYVALTFDDGPRADTTTRLLNGLKERHAVATFFLIGEQIPGNEELILRMKNEGHQVGNHTYDHTRLTNADKETILTEVGKTDTLLSELLGEGTYWLRPPYGLIEEPDRELIQVPMIQWTVDPEDWKLRNAQKIYSAVMETVKPDDIILLHDFYPTSVDAALRVIDMLQEQGYTLVTVEQMFALKDAEAQPGVLYRAPNVLSFS